ncbi:VirB3 family type IV secretion system protein [Streptobacillus moniliformis]|uniref:VirB3 family type IV secretion system protein n=1 Tax=Streptobacillus moniliformis TaxID=34105 RepID=UPI0007E4B314|nr:VirB3 family type IV secretion system protein [Streptobacillus moniliformis]
MKKLPVYKGIMESKTTFGIPISSYFYIGVFALILYILLETFLIIIPITILFAVLKIVSRKDSKFLQVFFRNLLHGNYYGF